MLKNKSQKMVTSALFVAVGLILPWLTAHAFGVPGTVLLPMHMPVLLCGLICGPYYGALVGVFAPALSSLLTGMPAFYPMLPIMVVQLLTMGLIAGLTFHKARLHVYLSLPASMVSGWVVYWLAYSALLFAGNGKLGALSITAALLQGIPGIILQLVFIPILLTALGRYQRRGGLSAQNPVDEAVALIKSGGVSCVVIRDENIIHTADGRGVSPLLKLYRDDPAKLKDAVVVDKIIGKAAAMLLVLGGAKRAYGIVMSAAGKEYLEQCGVAVEYGRCVDVISNRDKSGICPIEKSVLDTDDPEEGLARMTAAISELMGRAV